MENKKKILHLVEAFGGGIFTFLVEISNSMCDDYDITLAYAKRNQTPENFKEYFDKRIKFIEVKNFKRSIGFSDLKACREVKKIVDEVNPQIIHLHSSKAGIAGRMVISSKNRKLFYTPHGYSFLKQDDSKLKRIMYKAIEKTAAIIRPSCKIVACSEGEYKISKKLSKNSTFVNNGINTHEIDEIVGKNIENKIDIKNLKVCTIGRIGFQKAPADFNKIASSIPNIKFTWIGDGELRKELKSENIEVTSWLNKNDVLKNVLDADIFILPSLWEGLPIALLEAMYLKKLCIVSDVIGNRDVIHNGINGFVCDKIEDYVEVIKKIQNGEIDYNTIIENSYNDIKKIYNVDCMRDGYKKLYEE